MDSTRLRTLLSGSPQVLDQLGRTLGQSVFSSGGSAATPSSVGAPATASTTTDLANALHSLAGTPIAGTAPQFRAVVRDASSLDLATASLGTSVSRELIAGAAVDHVVGPLFNKLGSDVIIEFQTLMEAVSLLTVTGLTPLMLMTVEAFRLIVRPQTKFPLPAGSVWILSKLVTPGAPPDEYTGLTISSGTITFSEAPVLTAGKLTMTANSNVQVHLALQQPVPASNAGSGFGADARALGLLLPKTLDFHFQATGAVFGTAAIDGVGDASANVFGEAITATFIQGTAPVYDGSMLAIEIPLEPNLTELAITQSLSDWSKVEGSAPIKLCAWALPSTKIDVSHPVAAAGTGSLLLRCGDGLRASWPGLHDTPLRLTEPQVLAAPTALLLVDLKGGTSARLQTFKMWQDAQNIHGTNAEVQYGAKAKYQFVSFVTGREVVGVTCSANLQVDRPVRVNAEPFPVRTVNGTLVLGASDPGGVVSRQITLSAPMLLPPPSFAVAPIPGAAPPPPQVFAIALRNGLFKVSAAQSAALSGKWNMEAGAVEDGHLQLKFRTLAYLPTLPDPYVASLAGLETGFAVTGAPIQTSFPLAINMPWELLNCNVDWTSAAGANASGDAVVVSFELLPDPARTSGAALLQGAAVQNEPFPAVDAGPKLANNLANGMPDYAGAWDARTPRLDNCALLDVSTNADLLGVSFRVLRGRLMIMLQTHEVGEMPASIGVDGMDVVSSGAAVHAFMLPQISWEPLINLTAPRIIGDPPAGFNFYPDDGGPTRILNGSAETVALSPLPLAQFLEKKAKEDTFEGAALFTLPWAMQALARLRTHYVAEGQTRPGSQLLLPQESFSQGLKSGLRFQLVAGAPFAKGMSDAFMGGTVQRNNVLSAPGVETKASTLGGSVTEIFNQQFFTDLNADTGVPLTRIDLSGYGASSFSNWQDTGAPVASVSQAQFEIMMGRCAHELVQVESILYPWGIKVVRTITMLRVASGYAYRHDSGWRADGDGRFLFRYFVKVLGGAPPADRKQKAAPYAIHPGVVRALYDIQNILETKDVAPFLGTMTLAPGAIYLDEDGVEQVVKAGATYRDVNDVEQTVGNGQSMPLPVKLQPVFFDANVEMEGFVSGGKDRGAGVMVTPSKGILGFVQIKPFGLPLNAAELAELVTRQGSIGGPINCVVRAGGSKQQVRVNAFDFNNSLADDRSPVFAVAARGAALLPKDGSWGMVRHDAASGDVHPLPSNVSVPLIRAAQLVVDAAGAINFGGADPTKALTRIADPLEVVRKPVADTLNYGLLFATDTQKALFLTPSFAAGRADLLSKTPPLFADAFRIANSKAVFPNIGDAVSGFGDAISLLRDGGEFAPSGLADAGAAAFSVLDTAENQSFKLLKKVANFRLPDKEKVLLEFGGAFKLYIEYKAPPGKAGPDAKLDFDIDSAAGAVEDRWKGLMNDVAIVVDLGPINRLVTIKGDWNAANGSEAQYNGADSPTPEMVFSDDLKPVIELLQILQELQGESYKDAIRDGVKLAMGNKADSWEYKLSASKEIPLVHFPERDVPSPPLILDASLKLGLYLNESIQVTTDLNTLLPSAGAFLSFFGRLSINCFSVGAAAIYAVGQAELDIGADTAKGPSLGMKFGFGAQIVVAIPVVGNVSVLFVVGVEIYLDKTILSVSASMLYQGHAELLEGLVGITIMIEAKGTITRKSLPGGSDGTTLAAQVTFAIDISIFLVIDISFSKTWEEERQVA